MEDMERYGDYNDSEEEGSSSSRPILFILKIAVALLCVTVIALIGYRLYLFDYYPPAMRSLVFTDELTAYYHETDGDIGTLTQKLRFPYDDNRKGRFFCDHMFVVPGTGELQVALRFNLSTLSTVAADLGLDELDPDTVDYFSFRLTDNYGRIYDDLRFSDFDSKSMYRYFKLVFGGIDFDDPADGQGAPEWIRLEIFVNASDEPYSYVLVYENNEAYSAFTPYTPSKKEIPQ